MAYTLNGTNQYLELTGAPVASEPFTMACWVKKTNNTAQVVMATGPALTARHQLQADPSGVEAVSVSSGGATGSSGSVTNPVGAWTHIGGVFSAANSRLVYGNGVAGGANSTSITVASLAYVGIGVGYNAGSRAGFFGGDIAECAIWNAALTADEMAALAKGFAPLLVRPANLAFYVPLIRGVEELKLGSPVTVSGATVADHPRVRLR